MNNRLALLLLPLLLACVPAQAIEHAEKFQKLNKADADDPLNSPEVRQLALKEYDAWSAQLEALDDRKLPGEVAARKAARDAAKAQQRCAEREELRAPLAWCWNWQLEPGTYDPRLWAAPATGWAAGR